MSDIFAPLHSSIRQHSHILATGRSFHTFINDDGTAQSSYNTSPEDDTDDEYTNLPTDYNSEIIKVLHALIEYPSQRRVSNMFAIDSMRFCIDIEYICGKCFITLCQVNAPVIQEGHDDTEESEDLCEEDPCEEDPC
jgi:hypothetical protein